MAKDELFDNTILRIGNAKTNLRLATFRTWTENKKRKQLDVGFGNVVLRQVSNFFQLYLGKNKLQSMR
jgi:hypothetical protein